MKLKIPNILTIGRIVIVPIFILSFYLPGAMGDWIPFLIFVLASFTDFLDGFIGVGDTYLFLTIAAVVVGGTSLLGGYGGYGLSVIGVLILQIITTVLVGWGLSWQGQQFILGLLIIPMVALYARSPHIRTQI